MTVGQAEQKEAIMSSFVARIKNEQLGRETDAYFIDDYFGPHFYGVYIPEEDTFFGSLTEVAHLITLEEVKKLGWASA